MRKAFAEIVTQCNRAHEFCRLDGIYFPSDFFPQAKELLPLRFGASYDHATFRGEADFSRLNFEQEMSFKGTRFLQDARFGLTSFQGPVTYEAASFTGEANFLAVRFEKGANFDGMRCQSAQFTKAHFSSWASFRGTASDPLFSKAEVIFDETIFISPNDVRLTHADFGRCSLLRTDLRGIDFSGVVWGQRPWWAWNRRYLYVRQPEKEVRVELENAYRQIRQSYEDRRNYPEAGDFYYGEMEQKRQRTKSILNYLYWWSSGYGQRPAQAFLILLGLLGFQAWFLLWAGLEVSEMSPYELSRNWWNALLFNVLRTITFNTPLLEPVYPRGDVISMVGRILVSIQTALFVLAVNRKFKR